MYKTIYANGKEEGFSIIYELEYPDRKMKITVKEGTMRSFEVRLGVFRLDYECHRAMPNREGFKEQVKLIYQNSPNDFFEIFKAMEKENKDNRGYHLFESVINERKAQIEEELKAIEKNLN